MKSDARLQQEVTAELEWDTAIHAPEILVRVHDGVATLTGSISTLAEKWCSEQAARRVVGLKDIVDELQVKPFSPGETTDEGIARSACARLAHVNTLAACLVNAAVEKGWITLTGFVQWQYERQDAAHVVRFLQGVVGLSNEIAIRPGAGTAVSSSAIESALRRSSSRLAKDIAVTVIDGEVTLTGAIHSWIERDQAMHCAWGTAGVRSVVDRMNLVC